MKINSKFYDYYDYLNCFFDNKIFYRKNEKINSPYNFSVKRLDFHSGKTVFFKPLISVQQGELFFCGEYYPVIEVFYLKTNKPKYFYSYDKYLEYIENIYNENKNLIDYFTNKNIEEFFLDKVNKKELIFYRNQFGFDKCIFGFLSCNEQEQVKKDFNVAYFYLNDKNIELYPVLNSFEFYNIFSPEQAYQKIEYYLFNILDNQEKNELTGNDNEIAFSKGFTDKYSFRKEPK